MSDNTGDNNFSGEERLTLDTLRRLPGATCEAELRERAKRAFLAAAVIESTADQETSADGDRPDAGGKVVPFRRPAWLSLVAAAAVILIALVWYGGQPSQEWVVLDVVGAGGVDAAGERVVVGDRLQPGTLVTQAGSELEVQLGESLRFRLLEGTTLQLPPAPGRWFNRHREFLLSAGEVFGTSGSRPLGFDLQVVTADLTARLTGTTFAVISRSHASCVCLWEGGILVTSLAGGGEVVDLEPLRRVWIFKDGRPPEILPLDGRETMKLQMMDDAGIAPIKP